MSNMSDLMVRINGDTSNLRASLNDANKGIKNFAKQAEDGVNRISAGFKDLKTVVGGAVIAGAVMKVAQVMKDAAMAAIEYGDSVNKAMQKTGLAAEEFTSLAYAAKMNDVSMESLGNAFKKLQIATSEAGTGSKAVLEHFEALGINIEEFKNLHADQQFELIADRVMQLGSEADRTRALVGLFGKAGADLLPMMSEGAEGIRKLREEAAATGNVMNAEQIQKLADADDAIKRLEGAWESFSRTLTAKVAPALTTVFDMLSNSQQHKVRLLTESLEGINNNISDWEKDNPGAEMNDYIKYQYQKRRELEAELAKMGEYESTSGGPSSRGRGTPQTKLPGYKTEEEKKAAEDAAKADAAAKKEAQKLAIEKEKAELEERLAQIREDLAEKTAILKDVEAIRLDVMTEDEKESAKLADQMWTLDEAYKAGVITLREYNDLLGGILAKQAEGALAEIPMPKLEIEDATTALDNLRSMAEDFGMTLSSAFEDAIVGGGNLGDIVDGLIQDMIRMTVRALILKPLMDAIFGAMGVPTAGGAAAGTVGGKAGGGRLSGPTVVGERGPELLIPAGPSRIVNNHAMNQMSAAPNFKVEVTNKGSTPTKASQSNAHFDGKSWVVGIILEDLQRGGQISNGLGSTFGMRRQS